MKSYLIDPVVKRIEEMDYNGDWRTISQTIEASRGLFTVVNLYENDDSVFIDDEGLYVEDQRFWAHKNYPQPLAGPGLFLGTDQEGDSVAPKTDIKQLRNDIVFIGDKHHLALLHKIYGSIEDYRPYFFESEKETV